MIDLNRTFSEWFNKINMHYEGIVVCERKVKDIIDSHILEFFKEKDITFELVDNKWDVINRYVLQELPYPDFKPHHAPAYYIDPFNLTVTFQWWKENNMKRTKIIWDPRDETLDDLYEKKLKKVFNLI